MSMSKRRRRKQQWKHAMMVFFLCLVMAAVLVLVRACSEGMDQPYNKDYRPMDVQRMQGESH